MLDQDFIDFYSGSGTPAHYVQERHTPEYSNSIADFEIAFKPPQNEEDTDTIAIRPESNRDQARFSKRCNDRLKLLARQYGENLIGDEERSVRARIEMIESEIDSRVPRYTDDDWQLLKDFQDSLEWLNEE